MLPEPRQYSIPADLTRLGEVRRFAEGVAADFGLGDDARYQVRLAVSEAVTNAIQHGSSSPADSVRIDVLQVGDAIVFEVRDNGRFVPRVPRRGPMPERGRGLDFIRHVMDEVDVRVESTGTLVTFSKRR